MSPHSRGLSRRAGVFVALAGLCCATAVAGARSGAAAEPSTPTYLDTAYTFAERAADLVARMTLTEKVQQLHTNNAPAIPRLGVQQYTYWNEGQHGVNRLGADTAAGGQGAVDNVHATSFPTNFAASMSWDPALMYRETTAISDEARGFLDKALFGTGQNNLGPSADDYGSLTYWAPTVNLDRDPRWGRTDEAFGEDPYLVARMAGAFVNGYQGNTLTGQPTTPYLKVAATAKHYALNNVETNRLSGDSVTTEADLHQYYLRQFQSLISDAHVSGLMTSYNAVNGTPSAVNTYTLNQIAQRTFGFDGYVTSDCDAVETTWQNPPGGHAWAAPGWTSSTVNGQVVWTNAGTGATIAAAAGAEAYALRAGTALNCTGDQATLPNIKAAIGAGILSEGVLDAGLTRLFTVRMATGEFDPPAGNPYTQITKSVIESEQHQQLARTVAANSLVLLKNAAVAGTGGPLLPVSAAATKHVVILGDLAGKVTLGGYSGQPTVQVDAVQGITAAVRAAAPDATVTADAAGTSTTATGPAVLSDATKRAIQDADLVVEFAGTDGNTAHEAKDRSSLAMPGNYNSLIEQVAALGNPRTLLVLQAAGPVTIDGLRDRVPAILFSGYNGQSQGAALADVVFGAQNPAGHLNFTWYAGDSQLPSIMDYGLTAADTGGLGRTYQYFTGKPDYPFGYGLSYTTFRISDVVMDRRVASANGTVSVGLTVTNTGHLPGATVAQLYAATPGAGHGAAPLSRLAAFQKTTVLNPGQTQHVRLRVALRDLALWDTARSRAAVPSGTYRFRIGTDAATTVAERKVRVAGTWQPGVRYVTVQPEAVVYQAGQEFDLTGTNRWLADDTRPAEQPDRNLNIRADGIVTAVNGDQSFVDLSRAHVRYVSSNPGVAGVDRHGKVRAVKDGVATITATVNGVSGSAVIAVRGTLSPVTPVVIAAGRPATASATFTNGGRRAVTGVALSVTVPGGWSAIPASPTRYASVPGGRAVTATWQLTPDAGATPQQYTIGYTATSSEGTFEAGAQTNVPYASLGAAYDNTGISEDGVPALPGFDGGSLSFSAQALADDGFVSGSTVTVGGIQFTWPGTGVPDNIVCSGQAVPLSGAGSRLGFLGASNNGAGSGSGSIVYTDGSTQDFALGFADWWSGAAIPGTTIAATTPYLNNDTGRLNQTVHVYFASVPLDPGKRVADVVLPHVTDHGQVAQITALHVFAVAVAVGA